MKLDEVIKATRNRLNYSKNCLGDINGFIELNKEVISNECKNFISSEMSRYEKNIEYYSAILEILESEGDK